MAISGYPWLFMWSVLSVASTRAPGDSDRLCTVTLPSTGVVPPAPLPANAKVLMDSYDYISLLPRAIGGVWQQVDLDDNNDPGRGTEWSQNSNRPCRQTVNVCGFFEGPQNNWLITQYISRRVGDVLLPQVSVQVVFEFRGCDDLACQRTFVVNIYETSTEDSTIARETDNYRLVSRVASDDDTGLTPLNQTREIDFSTAAEGFYIAIRDETTCIELQRLTVFYNVCPGGPGDLVMRPETIAPPIGRMSQPLEVTAQCVEGASPDGEGEVRLNCNQGGVWNAIAGSGCSCDPGFDTSADRRSCIALCGAGEYYSVIFAECRVCPANTVTRDSGLAVCPCAEGYYRAEGDDDLPCTPSSAGVLSIPMIGMDETMVFVDEDVGERELCASVMNGTLDKEVSVMVIYENRDAIANEDYIAKFINLTFSPDMTRVCFNTTIINDDRHELQEDFFVIITTSDPDIDIMPSNTIVMIDDEDTIVQTRVGFQQSSYTVREANGLLEVCVEVFTPQQDEELVSDISLIVESETSTARNSDFTDVGQHPVLFTALGPCVQCFDVVITNDNFAEGTETFSLILKQDPLLGSTGVVIEPNVAEITILDDSSDTCPGGFLFFELNGVVYEPNSIILISQLRTSTTSSSVTDPGSSLVCMTEGINTECCRNRDGGNIGEWVYPDGSMVPRNSNSQGSDFSRSGFTHQIRLNRLTDSLGPVGTYMCVVPPQSGCGDEMHVASVQLVLPVPGEMLSLCPITVWGPPRGPFGDYTGYDLRYFLPDGNEMVINKRGNEFFQLVTDEVRSLGPLEDILVQVRARAGSHVGPYTREVVVCPMDFVRN